MKESTPRYWIITIQWRGVASPGLYKCQWPTRPTIEELQSLGADIHPPRKDKVTTQSVKRAIYDSWPGTWLRPIGPEERYIRRDAEGNIIPLREWGREERL